MLLNAQLRPPNVIISVTKVTSVRMSAGVRSNANHEGVSIGNSNNADPDRAISWDSGVDVVARPWPQLVARWWYETEKGHQFHWRASSQQRDVVPGDYF